MDMDLPNGLTNDDLPGEGSDDSVYCPYTNSSTARLQKAGSLRNCVKLECADEAFQRQTAAIAATRLRIITSRTDRPPDLDKVRPGLCHTP